MAFQFKPTFGAATTSTAASSGLFRTTTTATPSFGFGTNTAGTPAFGAANTTSTSGFGGFGMSATPAFGTTTTSAATGFGFGTSATPAFGTQTSIAPATGFGGLGTFGTTPATSMPSFGLGNTGFGTGTGTTGFGTGLTGFGTTGTGTNTSAFGTGTSFMGAAATTAMAGFGPTFGLKPGQTTMLGAPPAAGATTGMFGAQASQAQSVVAPLSSVVTAVSMPAIFGDERDTVIAKWNQLQAFWGAGRGYFNQQGHYIDFAPDNPYSFFKAVGYNILPSQRNEDGLIALIIDRKMSEVSDNQQAVVDTLQRIIINNQPNATLCVEGIRPQVDDKTEMVVYVQQRANTGVTTRVTASDLFNHLNTLKQQLTTQLAISAAVPKTGMTLDQKKLYLDNPPVGIDARIWEQAKLDNPDTERMIPVPMVGFSELHSRLKHQEQQTTLHQTRLDLIANDIAALQRNQADIVAKTEQYKRSQLVLGHRILKVLVKQELYRKHGYAIQADEEQLRTKLEAIYAELSAPMQFKGRLNELMSQMRMQKQIGSTVRHDSSYQIDNNVQLELKQHLKRQQDGLAVLIQVIRDDLQDLKVIEQGLTESSKLRR